MSLKSLREDVIEVFKSVHGKYDININFMLNFEARDDVKMS